MLLSSWAELWVFQWTLCQFQVWRLYLVNVHRKLGQIRFFISSRGSKTFLPSLWYQRQSKDLENDTRGPLSSSGTFDGSRAKSTGSVHLWVKVHFSLVIFPPAWLENESCWGDALFIGRSNRGKAMGKNGSVDLILSLSSLPVEVTRSKRPARELQDPVQDFPGLFLAIYVRWLRKFL